MYSDDRSMYPLCVIPTDHTRLYFEADSNGRDPAGIPCVLHLSNGKTLAHAFDTHEHFKGAMLEEVRCSRTYVGHQFSDWECKATPPLPTALYLKYRVHCVQEERDGTMENLQQYFHDRYNYAMTLFDDSMSVQMVSTTLNKFISSVKRSVSWSLTSPSSQRNLQSTDFSGGPVVSGHRASADSPGPTLLKTTYLSDEDRNPAYMMHFSGGPSNSGLMGVEAVEEEIKSDNPELLKLLPADFCAVTYSIKSNHYYLTLIAGSSMWVFFPICTIVAGLMITSVTSVFHGQVLAEQGITLRHNPSPVDVCLRITRVCCATVVFCVVNAFIYFVAKGVLDVYSYVDGATATATLMIQYIMWLLTSIIYLWTIPTGYDMFYPILPESMRRRLAFLETEFSTAQHKKREFERRNARRKDNSPLTDLFSDGDGDMETGMVEDPVGSPEEGVSGVRTEETDGATSVFAELLEKRHPHNPDESDEHKVD